MMQPRHYRLYWLLISALTSTVLLFVVFLNLGGISPAQSMPAEPVRNQAFASLPQPIAAEPLRTQASSRDTNAALGAAGPNLQRSLAGPASIENCDVVTFTLYITNAGTTAATSVRVTDTMPSGFDPTSRSVSLGSINPGQSVSVPFTFTAGCDAVSGQNVATLTDDQGDNYVDRQDFAVVPGAITLRKEPAVIPAKLGEVVTWTVYVDSTGYGRASNVRVTDTLGSGLAYVSGITTTSYVTIPAGETRAFTISARVIACSGLDNNVQATWGCGATTCQTQTVKASIAFQSTEPLLDLSLPTINIDYCTGSGSYSVTVTNTGSGAAYTPTISVDFSPRNRSDGIGSTDQHWRPGCWATATGADHHE